MAQSARLLRRLRVLVSRLGTPAATAAQPALDRLATEVAVAQGADFAAEAQLSLGRVRDQAHDHYWSQWCIPDPAGLGQGSAAQMVAAVPWTPQGCWYRSRAAGDWAGDLWGDLTHYIFKYVNIGLCLVIMIVTLVYRGAFHGEYVLIHRTIAVFIAVRLARVAAFSATALPAINLSCRERFH